MVEQAKACFVLPQQEAIALFAHQDLRPMETEVGSSAYDNAHSNIDVSANLRVGFLPLLGEQARQFLQQSFGFIAEESIHRYHKRRKMTTLSEASLKILLLTI
jgi:hypothetical protein